MATVAADSRWPDTAEADQDLVAAAVPTGRFFKVLADPTRLAILRLLLIREHSVSELIEALGVPQSRVSNHLACLRWCRFVTFDRCARRSVYRIADPRLAGVVRVAELVSADLCAHLGSCTRIGPQWI